MINLDKVKNELDTKGWCILNEKIYSTIESKLLCLGFGSPLQEFEVKVRKNPNTVIESSSKMQFHIDAPMARYVLWQCQTEGLKDEKVLFFDVLDLEQNFSESEIKSLENTIVGLPENYQAKGEIFKSYNHYPLVQKLDGQYLLNYTDWLDIKWENDKIKQKFLNYGINYFRKSNTEIVG